MYLIWSQLAIQWQNTEHKKKKAKPKEIKKRHVQHD